MQVQGKPPLVSEGARGLMAAIIGSPILEGDTIRLDGAIQMAPR
ncbi:hypothetical protein [Rhodococcus koreensis]|nr:hypothetical protein [Rhodococcus koreensis]